MSSTAGYGKAKDAFRTDVRELIKQIATSQRSTTTLTEFRAVLSELIEQKEDDKLYRKHSALFDRYPGEYSDVEVDEGAFDDFVKVLAALDLVRLKDEAIEIIA